MARDYYFFTSENKTLSCSLPRKSQPLPLTDLVRKSIANNPTRNTKNTPRTLGCRRVFNRLVEKLDVVVLRVSGSAGLVCAGG